MFQVNCVVISEASEQTSCPEECHFFCIINMQIICNAPSYLSCPRQNSGHKEKSEYWHWKTTTKKKTCQIKRLIIILSLCFIFQVKLFLCQHSPQCPLDVEKNHFIFNAKLYFLKPKAQKVSVELCLLKHEYKKFHFLKKFCGPSIEQMGRMTFQSAGIISILYSLVWTYSY